jgi:mono/diheme cytochrome c family protein
MGFYRFAAMAALVLVPAAQAEDRTLLESGRRAYEIHCSNCHGPDAAGDGPLAELLSVQPTDLRRMPLDADGNFPFTRLSRVIDGRETVRGHGLSEMPVWGLTFIERGDDSPRAGEVQARILELVQYLRSIQIPKAGAHAAPD